MPLFHETDITSLYFIGCFSQCICNLGFLLVSQGIQIGYAVLIMSIRCQIVLPKQQPRSHETNVLLCAMQSLKLKKISYSIERQKIKQFNNKQHSFTDFFCSVFSCFKVLSFMFGMDLEGSSIFFLPAIILMKGRYEDFTSFIKLMTEIAVLDASCTVLSNFHEVTNLVVIQS